VKYVLLLVALVGGSLVIVLGPSLLLSAAALTAGDSQSGPSALATAEIPAVLLPRYEEAPACSGLPWQVVAAIGYVESRHASTGVARIEPATGNVAPPIVGIALDGHGVAAIRVPPGGSPWHSDRVWDHAVGPMQFITATWARWGVDASGDGVASPHNAFDAIATAGRYLCAGKKSLSGTGELKLAIGRYNNSATYVRSVMDKAYDYGMVDGGDLVGALTAPGPPDADGPQLHGDVAAVVEYAQAHVGDPYVWGADGPGSFDCSGLTMAAYQRIGVRLPHRSDHQVRYGRSVNWRTSSIKAGDLIFLRGGSPVHDYGHVGLAIGSGRWVAAPRTGEQVHVEDLPYQRVQAVRRIVLDE
jgi:hypothetical protein